MKQSPGTWVAFGVEGQSASGIVVLVEAPFEVGGLADVSLALWIQPNVYEIRHGSWLPGLDSN
ncbi:MAG TPA: hypothetical protein VGZ48_10240 [Candidatus Acidoferrales bacterium]|nr:hypothetical protein [Candidatus Acidoferrales bacterium]